VIGNLVVCLNVIIKRSGFNWVFCNVVEMSMFESFSKMNYDDDLHMSFSCYFFLCIYYSFLRKPIAFCFFFGLQTITFDLGMILDGSVHPLITFFIFVYFLFVGYY
jgi:hypothetical protein